jgi:hypothetical protein
VLTSYLVEGDVDATRLDFKTHNLLIQRRIRVPFFAMQRAGRDIFSETTGYAIQVFVDVAVVEAD